MINFEAHDKGFFQVSYVRSSGLDTPQEELFENAIAIDEFVNYCEIHSSLDMAFRVGILSLYDSISFREKLGFIGNDIITINYTTQDLSENTDLEERKQVSFRIINIEEVVDSTTDVKLTSGKRRTLNLTLAEFPLYDYYVVNQIYRTYDWGSGDETTKPQGTQTISDIVTDLLSEEVSPNLLNGWGYETDIQDTNDLSDPDKKWNFYVPRWSLLKTVNYLKRFAISNEGNYPNYIFTSRDILDRKIISFKSVYSIINDDQAKRNIIEYTPRSVIQDIIGKDPNKANPAWLVNTVLSWSYSFYNGFDISFGGLSGKTYLTHDLYDGLKAQAYSFEQYKSDYKIGLDSYYIYKDSFGDQWSNIYYNAFENKNDNLMINAYAKKALGSVRCQAKCYLNPFRYIGQHARLNFNSVDPINGGQIDAINNGDWITWGITDVFTTGGSCFSVVDFRKDSVFLNSTVSNGLETAGG